MKSKVRKKSVKCPPSDVMLPTVTVNRTYFRTSENTGHNCTLAVVKTAFDGRQTAYTLVDRASRSRSRLVI